VSEKKITEDDVRAEHLAAVNVRVQWLYLGGVIAGAFVVMVVLIALLGATA
jgi:hypothetical protein